MFFKRRRFFCVIFLVFLGVFRGIFWKPDHPTQYFYERLPICGTVGFPSEGGSDRERRILEDLLLKAEPAWGRIEVSFHQRHCPLLKKVSVGSRLCFSAIIRPIRNFGISGEFDFERYYLKKKIWGRVTLSRKDFIHVQSGGSFYPIQKLREQFSRYLSQFSGDQIL